MRFSRLIGLAAAAALTVGLAACAADAPQNTDSAVGSNPASDDAFPVTIEHIYGETTITEKPERVATVAWANHEVPLALGIVPVGMSRVAWGDDDDNGILPGSRTSSPSSAPMTLYCSTRQTASTSKPSPTQTPM